MADEQAILILGDHATRLSDLAERCRRLGYRTVRARTVDDAGALADGRGFRFGLALLGPSSAENAPDLVASLDLLRQRCRSPHMCCIATGPPPSDDATRRWLRRAGIERALWEPVGEHGLRFELNRALRPSRAELLREDERIPCDWRARVTGAGRIKEATVYSLSAGGAFLATERPSQRGNAVHILLFPPGGPLELPAQVVYTNVPGNLRKRSLPDGMAVRFERLPAEMEQALRSRLQQGAARFAV